MTGTESARAEATEAREVVIGGGIREVVIPQRIGDIFRINLFDEAARGVGLVLAVAHPGVGEREADGLLGARHRNVEKAALLLDVGRGGQHASGREQILLQAGHIDIGELKTFGRVHRHKGDLVVGVLLVLHVHIGKQGDVLQEISQREHRVTDLRVLLGLSLDDEVAEIFIPPFLDEMGDTVDEFLDVGGPGLSLDGRVVLVEGVQAAGVGDARGKLVGVGRGHLRRESVDHLTE